MTYKLICFLIIAATSFSIPSTAQETLTNFYLNGSVLQDFVKAQPPLPTIKEIEEMLNSKEAAISPAVINRVLMTLKCANQYQVDHNNILTIIDYSLPSSQKRLWVFDMTDKKLLFHTYVSHGIKSGVSTCNFFSNKNNSKASSIGLYKTDATYYGRHGLSLKMDGLERGFNDNASNRSVVMHGGWYVEDDFIKKYGRAGRSWGCPAVPEHLTASIINTIKNGSLFVAYSPDDHWLLTSKFQHCERPQMPAIIVQKNSAILGKPDDETLEGVVYADLHQNNKLNDSDPLVVIKADTYTNIFHTVAPLSRMLRRQINQVEYIALSPDELKRLLASQTTTKINWDDFYFVVPDIKMVRGYYETQMKLISLGKITNITPNDKGADSGYVLHSDKQSSVHLKATHQFIRWVGL